MKEMAKSPTFIILLIWNICMRICGLILLDHAASMAAFFGGLAIIAMMVSPANGLGSMVAGATMDKIGLKRIAVIAPP
ncbi:MAG: hypothetical protein LUE27_03585 [Clostridia bacterium]|nr:hypothetical protein [Clostridia bacterium]